MLQRQDRVERGFWPTEEMGWEGGSARAGHHHMPSTQHAGQPVKEVWSQMPSPCVLAAAWRIPLFTWPQGIILLLVGCTELKRFMGSTLHIKVLTQRMAEQMGE